MFCGLDRNVTITATAGRDSVLDLNFVRAGVQLCAQCKLVFANITVANERHGIGSGVDFVLGSPGGAVLFINAQRLRLACTEPTDAAQSLENSVRSAVLPGKNGIQQFGFADTTFKVSWAKVLQQWKGRGRNDTIAGRRQGTAGLGRV
jgi:hypothetical protein